MSQFGAEPRRLTKDPDNKMIAGIASGIANYYGLDVTLVRLGFAILGLFGGGAILYIILWFVIPDPPAGMETQTVERDPFFEEAADEIFFETEDLPEPETVEIEEIAAEPIVEIADELPADPLEEGADSITPPDYEDDAFESSEDLLRAAREELSEPDET